ncbi:MAG: COQ9 family protein [Paracoccus sp. (in: a-proteobacteria)]|uniref:COQ9 family protein n=1 Tax=Paracoccus sp. TaxID=267 RepID=UPI0026DF220E|nr:COQ9 family protein [Paracoccus sp. (in: a-proteobacteria)]MDO5622121.1 COQ9 family protein [Paracoccus sp. (in: a-proteobacteria)]
MTTEQEKLLKAALVHVPFDGMNDAALRAGARDLNLSEQAIRVHFPRGGADLAAAYHRRADAALRVALAANPPQGRFRDKVADAVWQRLALVQPELVRAGAATLSLPQHQPLAAKLVWETADAIWSGLGDTSDDVNWYSKRATLSAVIGSAVLYWLGDDSEGHRDTRAFIDRRIDGVMQFEKLKASARKLPGMAVLADLATGWIKAPLDRVAPGKGGDA